MVNIWWWWWWCYCCYRCCCTKLACAYTFRYMHTHRTPICSTCNFYWPLCKSWWISLHANKNEPNCVWVRERERDGWREIKTFLSNEKYSYSLPATSKSTTIAHKNISAAKKNPSISQSSLEKMFAFFVCLFLVFLLLLLVCSECITVSCCYFLLNDSRWLLQIHMIFLLRLGSCISKTIYICV